MESLRKQAARILREQKKYKIWLAAFLCLALLVTAGTVAALTMSGQALNRKEKVLICQAEAHQHTEQCRDSEGKLVCGQADYIVHVHNDDCYGEDGALVCAIPERKPHVHDAACFQEEKVLACGQEESQGHQHGEACYTGVKGELTCGADETAHQHGPECYTKVQGELICGAEEAGHQHGPECYTRIQGDLTCASEEEGHVHTDECYAWSEELTCGQTEETHTHTDECYAWSEELTCGQTEEAHVHTDECYAWTEELTCQVPEGEGAHIHTDECYETETVAICGELELHAHDEKGCYDQEGNLICEELELLEHVHGEGCFEIVEPEGPEESGEAVDESAEETAEGSGASEESEAAEDEESEALEGTEASEEDGEEDGVGEDDSEDDLLSEEESEEEPEEEGIVTQECETGTVKVIAQYGPEAELPENAKLQAANIDRDSEEYQRYEQEFKAQLGDEEAVAGVALKIGFYVDGIEVEPKAPVSITIQMLDAQYEDGEEMDVVHFGKEETEKLDASNIVTNQDGTKTTSFEVGSFSVFMLKAKAADKKDTVNFYVNLNCQIAADTQAQGNGDFSTSVWEATVSGASYSNNMPKAYYKEYNSGSDKIRRVLAAESNQNAVRINSLIRQLKTGVAVPSAVQEVYGDVPYNGSATYKLSSFPTDSQVLAELQKAAVRKNKDIIVDGTVVQPTELTEANFTIRWYTFHYNSGDYWHVDGVLVRKAAKIKVMKTFYGDATAVPDDFSITLKSNKNTSLSLRTLTLNDGKAAVSSDGTTYRWEVDVDPNTEYTIEENNYISARPDIATMAQYNIPASGQEGEAEWLTYERDTIKLQSGSYNTDESQTGNYPTVNLKNSYLPNNSIHVFKTDATSGNGLAGVEFALQKDGGSVDVWKDGTNYYLYDPTASVAGAAKLEANENLAVDASGNLTILYNEKNFGSYTLAEVTYPKDNGQDMYTPVTVSFTISKPDADGKVDSVDPVGSLPEGVELNKDEDKNSYELKIPNKPKTMDIAVQKVWAEGTPDEEKVPVTVKLFRETTDAATGAVTQDSILVDGSEEIVLNADNGWKKEGIQVPAYVDAQKAVYAIQETKIGTVESDSGEDDGYKYYNVTYESSDDGKTLTVKNELDCAAITFNKVDGHDNKPLEGAKFALYKDYEGKEFVAEAESSADGVVSFGYLKGDAFYMKETAAPEKYEESDRTYKVVIVEEGGKKVGKIYLTDENGNVLDETKPVSTITNELKRLDGIRLRKIANESSTQLPGAKFILSREEDGQYVAGIDETSRIASWGDRDQAYVFEDVESDGEGALPRLEEGTYYLIETEAPAGYHLLEASVGFRVALKNDGSFELSIIDPNKATKEGNTIIISNSTGYMLPETGGPGTVMYALGGLAVIATSLVYGLGMRRRKEKGGRN